LEEVDVSIASGSDRGMSSFEEFSLLGSPMDDTSDLAE
jgi:hypothetical protein